MGRKVQKIDLSDAEVLALEMGYKNRSNTQFSRRCHIILLKSNGYSSIEIADLLLINKQTVYKWVKRYKSHNIQGLKTKVGQGRKPILDEETDKKMVRVIVEKERQRLHLAKEELEASLNKEFSLQTLKRFLKRLTADGNEYA